MKILAVSDEECPALWDYYTPGKLKDYDLIISCGDLHADYLSFLVTMARAPLLYVHGNHDTSYAQKPPEGCDDIDGHLVIYKGLRILGLGGCLKYHPGPYQYTDDQMRKRINKLRIALWRAGGVDLVVTHAPPRNLGDREDPAHTGFQALVELLDKYHPQYLIHGHVHQSYSTNMVRQVSYKDTKIININPRFNLELPDRPYKHRGFDDLVWVTHPQKKPYE